MEQKWFEYIDSLASGNTMNDGYATDVGSAEDMFPKHPLYQVISLDQNEFPVFVPTVLTQGVWSSTMTSLVSTRPPVGTLPKSGAQLHVELLKTSHVLYPTLKIPFEVLLLLNQFQTLYTQEHTGRLLIWNYPVSTAIITASFKSKEFGLVKTYELVCSFFQLLVLNLFNHKEQYTYADIADFTGIINPAQLEDSTINLNSALASLSHPKVGILVKFPNTPLMTPADTFTWNHNFKCATTRFHIPKIDPASIKQLTAPKSATSPTSTAPGAAGVSKNTLFRRENAVDASIIRLLKRQKEMFHGELIKQVQESLTHLFVPDEAFIKQRIEALIDKFDIERDDVDRKKYRYT
jgi:cullin 3